MLLANLKSFERRVVACGISDWYVCNECALPSNYALERFVTDVFLLRTATLIAATLLSFEADADDVSDFHAAQEKWNSLGAQSYSFIFHWQGAVVVAPRCAGARIRVRVKDGVPSAPVVVKGTRQCPKGTTGARAIGLWVPRHIEDAFAEMRRYIESPPVRAKITAHYDEQTGAPLEYYVEKLDIPDNDEGFRISELRLRK